MRGGLRRGEQTAQPAAVTRSPTPASGSAARDGGLASRAAALQRAAGNRAAARVLARWVKHPDADKKGVMVPDVVAEDFARFNPPQNK
jgi:hypothetical protein